MVNKSLKKNVLFRNAGLQDSLGVEQVSEKRTRSCPLEGCIKVTLTMQNGDFTAISEGDTVMWSYLIFFYTFKMQKNSMGTRTGAKA